MKKIYQTVNQEITTEPDSTTRLIWTIRNTIGHLYTKTDERISIVLEGFKKKIEVSKLHRIEDINASIYYKCIIFFMEVSTSCQKGNSLCVANYSKVTELKKENEDLKALLGEQLWK